MRRNGPSATRPGPTVIIFRYSCLMGWKLDLPKYTMGVVLRAFFPPKGAQATRSRNLLSSAFSAPRARTLYVAAYFNHRWPELIKTDAIMCIQVPFGRKREGPEKHRHETDPLKGDVRKNFRHRSFLSRCRIRIGTQIYIPLIITVHWHRKCLFFPPPLVQPRHLNYRPVSVSQYYQPWQPNRNVKRIDFPSSSVVVRVNSACGLEFRVKYRQLKLIYSRMA